MSGQQTPCPGGAPAPCEIEPGTILVNWVGQIKVVRSRTNDDTGWNCADGAAIADTQANDTELWHAYTPQQLADDLVLAREVHDISGHRVLGGGLATWDACSGRPCVLPRLAKLVHRRDDPNWTPALNDVDL